MSEKHLSRRTLVPEAKRTRCELIGVWMELIIVGYTGIFGEKRLPDWVPNTQM